jgi:hypothetical protein
MVIKNQTESNLKATEENSQGQGSFINEKIKIDQWREIILKAIDKTEKTKVNGKKNKTSPIKAKSQPQAEKKLTTIVTIEKKEPLAKEIKKTISQKVSPKSFKEPLIRPPEFTRLSKLTVLKKIVRLTLILVGFLFFLSLVAIIFFGIGLYKYQWNDYYTNQVIKIIPYPVALVNNQILSWSEFRENVLALRHYYKKQEEASGGVKIVPPREKIQEDILRVMITNELMKQMAAKYKISPSQIEIEKRWLEISQPAGGEAKVQEIIKDLYGWNIKTYKKRILVPRLLADKLENYFSSIKNKKLDEVLKEFQAQSEIRRFFY